MVPKNKNRDTNPMIGAEKTHFKFFLSYVGVLKIMNNVMQLRKKQMYLLFTPGPRSILKINSTYFDLSKLIKE